jgi:transcriptional regulator with XRE-family HTH domain
MLPGSLLRQARERLGLTFREVEHASYQLASLRGRADFIIHISRLADIENHGAVPSPHKLYSLAAIYHLNPVEVFEWYEVPLDRHFMDGAELAAPRTHLAAAPSGFRLPMRFDPGFDPRRSELLSRMVEAWKELEGALFNADSRYLYGYIGLDDHCMEPILRPGSLVLIDPIKREVSNSGWRNEFERPIYFFDLREGYKCSWCLQEDHRIIIQPHPLSKCAPRSFRYPDEAEVVGQVIGVVMRFASP